MSFNLCDSNTNRFESSSVLILERFDRLIIVLETQMLTMDRKKVATI